MEETTSILLPSQRYAAAALFALALHQSQIHQAQNPDTPRDANPDGVGGGDAAIASVSDSPKLWIHDKSGLLCPVFRFLGMDDQTSRGLRETAGSSSQDKHRIGAFLKLLSEEDDATSSERLDKEVALTKAIDATAESIDPAAHSPLAESGSHKLQTASSGDSFGMKSPAAVAQTSNETNESSALLLQKKQFPPAFENEALEQSLEEANLISYQRKVSVLYELLSACVADIAEADKCCHSRQGYDARHRVALRLLAVWLGIQWIEMVCVLGYLKQWRPL